MNNNIELLRKIAPVNQIGSTDFEPNPILPRPEVSAEKQAIYERRLAEIALQRISPNKAQDKADEIRKRYQYGNHKSKIA